ncbi:right-handed parallel beta-helix repeat-containing protein [bacterium]|nr:right-handed parallel beta-helix repeat-containing protein [bacterium]
MSLIRFSDYRPDITGQENALPVFEKALEECRKEGECEFLIEPGTYLLRDQAAIDLFEKVLSLDDNSENAGTIFQMNRPYVKGLDLGKLSGVTVSARGVTLLCEGIMEPVSIIGSSDLILQGLTIRYARPPFTQGRIIDVKDGFYDVALDPDTPLEKGASNCRIAFWDVKSQRLDPFQRKPEQRNEIIAPGILRIHASVDPKHIGNIAIIYHTFHSRPAIFINESSNITLKDITIHNHPGMGVVGNRSRNITMRGLRVVPLPGKKLATNTDATHFTNCRGTVEFENCLFSCQGDDATNLHNFYYHMERLPEDPVSAYLKVEVTTHSLLQDSPDEGDVMEIVDFTTMNVLTARKVLKVEKDVENLRSLVTFDAPIPECENETAAINVSALPSLIMRGCHISTHRARGVLIKTRNVLVENCTIEETTLSAIHIGVEKYWDEGPGSENVIIRGNRFVRCGYGGDCSGILINCECETPSLSRVHNNILIENNVIENETELPDVIVSGAKKVVMRGNAFSRPKEQAVVCKDSERVVFER